MFNEEPPRVKDWQPPYTNMEERELVKAKLEKVLDRGYVVLRDIEEVESLMFMFHVPKGDSDVRMRPRFPLQYRQSALRPNLGAGRPSFEQCRATVRLVE